MNQRMGESIFEKKRIVCFDEDASGEGGSVRGWSVNHGHAVESRYTPRYQDLDRSYLRIRQMSSMPRRDQRAKIR